MNLIAIELVLIALGYVAISMLAQRKFSNIERIKEIKIDMNNRLARVKKMTNIDKDEIAKEQKEIAALTSEMMKHQLKSSFIILPIFIILVYVALPYEFGSQQFSISFMSFTFTYKTFFILAAFVFGLLSSVVIAIYDKFAAKKASEIQETDATTSAQE